MNQAEKASKKAAKKARKLAKREAKRKAKQEKKALVSLHKRPIVCPPDKAGRHFAFRLFGYICRTLVVWAAASGLIIFISAALELGVSNGHIALTTLIVTSLIAAMLYSPVGKLIGGLGTIGCGVWLALKFMGAWADIFWSLIALYNAALARLYKVGYLAYIRYQVPVGTSTPTEELLEIGVSILCIIVASVFAFCLVRRVRIIPPAILATTLLVVILTFNVYSNRIASNLGIALVIVSFATILVMAAYDKLYHVKDARKYDTTLNLFGDSDRPTLPPEYVAEQERKAAARTARKIERKKKRSRPKTPVTVEDELNDYFGGKKPKKPQGEGKKKPTLSPAERRAERQKKREIAKRVRAVKHYDRITAQSKAAMGGFASAATMALCFLIIALPALSVTGNFNTIDAIDEKMAYARDYVTAVLRGDDAKLDELEYGADKNNFKPHSTDLEQLAFTGKQIFYVESRFDTNYYLRGWIGTGYEDGAWLSVDDATLDAYRAMYDTSESPAEENKYNFYHYMMPSLVDDPDYMGENYLSKYKSNRLYGFVNALVSVRRVNSPSTLTHFPTTFKSTEGIFDYGTTNLSELTYVNYFDGLYTGRKFAENGVSQASVTYAQLMTEANWASNQAKLISAFNLQKEVLLAREGIKVKADGSVTSYLTLITEDRPDGTTMFAYQYKNGKDERTWRYYHDTDSIIRDGSFIYVQTSGGTMIMTVSGKKLQSAEYVATDGAIYQNLVELYDRSMTDAERSALMTYLKDHDAYADFVYNTYTGKSGSTIIADLAKIIADKAHTEEQREEIIYYEDDPETPEDDAWEQIKRVWVNVPADVSLADVQDSSLADVYIQRDLLVRNVVDYLNTEQGCTYTITPDLTLVDETLDGVENFLLNTKQGYCVQFASAAALILRELGIPVRYVEGYIASELSRRGSASSSEFVYGGYVKDYEAHAWIEVYFDGVGWVTYETTPAPQYYNSMYGFKAGNSTIGDKPIVPEFDTQPPSEDETLPPLGDEETDTTHETMVDDNSEEVMRGSLIALGVIVALAGIIALISHIVSSARRAEYKRQDVVSQVLTEHFGQNTSPEDRQEMALSMSDAVTTLLTLYGLAPKPGEFRDEYAVRLTSELHSPADARKDGNIPLPDLHKLLDAMAAEEFGHGMTIDEMKQLAIFYLYLRQELKHRLPFFSRVYLHYVKHLI